MTSWHTDHGSGRTAWDMGTWDGGAAGWGQEKRNFLLLLALLVLLCSWGGAGGRGVRERRRPT